MYLVRKCVWGAFNQFLKSRLIFDPTDEWMWNMTYLYFFLMPSNKRVFISILKYFIVCLLKLLHPYFKERKKGPFKRTITYRHLHTRTKHTHTRAHDPTAIHGNMRWWKRVDTTFENRLGDGERPISVCNRTSFLSDDPSNWNQHLSHSFWCDISFQCINFESYYELIQISDRWKKQRHNWICLLLPGCCWFKTDTIEKQDRDRGKEGKRNEVMQVEYEWDILFEDESSLLRWNDDNWDWMNGCCVSFRVEISEYYSYRDIDDSDYILYFHIR